MSTRSTQAAFSSQSIEGDQRKGSSKKQSKKTVAKNAASIQEAVKGLRLISQESAEWAKENPGMFVGFG